MNEIDIKNTPGERLAVVADRRGWTTAKLAKHTGYSVPSVQAHKNGWRGISERAARVYARTLGVDPGLILYGKDFNQETENTSQLLTRRVVLLRVPLLSSREIDKFHAIAGGARPMSEETVFAPIDLPEGHRVYSVLMPDDSMATGEAKAIFRGEPVFIDPDAAYKAGDIVAATLPGCEEILIRKYRRVGTDATGAEEFDLVALNEDHGVESAAKARGAAIVGKIIGVYRAF